MHIHSCDQGSPRVLVAVRPSGTEQHWKLELWKGVKSTYLHFLIYHIPKSYSEMGLTFSARKALTFFNFQKQYTENDCIWEADLALCCVLTMHIWKSSFCNACLDMTEFTKSIYAPFVLQCGLYTLSWLTVQKKKYIIVEQKRRKIFSWNEWITWPTF